MANGWLSAGQARRHGIGIPSKVAQLAISGVQIAKACGPSPGLEYAILVRTSMFARNNGHQKFKPGD